ncbi:hypothetical protein MMC22_008334 [Lobaria immixta]|nr:hypothetical protein [Lobaria immixta]
MASLRRISPLATRHLRFLASLIVAIIVVLDELAPEPVPEPDGSASLGRLLREQNVLLVLTGDDSNLSAPINFESIRAQSLPLARNDIPVNPKIDAVRVSLATAVRFIADLQQREEMAFPNLRDYSVIDQSISPCTQNFGGGNLNADAYAGMVMQRVEENGINNVSEAYDAVVRVKAA